MAGAASAAWTNTETAYSNGFALRAGLNSGTKIPAPPSPAERASTEGVTWRDPSWRDRIASPMWAARARRSKGLLLKRQSETEHTRPGHTVPPRLGSGGAPSGNLLFVCIVLVPGGRPPVDLRGER